MNGITFDRIHFLLLYSVYYYILFSACDALSTKSYISC
jgi:hypothetical protein